MSIKSLFLATLLCVVSRVPFAQRSQNSDSNPKRLRTADHVYEDNIKTVLMFPNSGPLQGILTTSTQMGQFNLRLVFDDLTDQQANYYARIIHCNYDWTKSNLFDLDFMSEYNEFPVTNFEFSVDTFFPYITYWIDLPPVKISGNYVVMIYREGDKSDVILTRRFMVYENLVSLTGGNNQVVSGGIALINQQMNFTINYKRIEVINPLESIRVTVRQNQRWDNMATDLKPAFVREFQRELEYRFFEDKNMFKGGNEFRFFDLRSLLNPGRNVQNVDRSKRPWEAYIQIDKSRADEVYSQYDDLNGNYLISNFDYRDASFTNYIDVNFKLRSPVPIAGEVYVAGAFNYWNTDDNNRMTYDTLAGEYNARIFLKQGWYDYQYLVKSPTVVPYYFEGSHFETENEYEIFVYYKPIQAKSEFLIGYTRVMKNKR